MENKYLRGLAYFLYVPGAILCLRAIFDLASLGQGLVGAGLCMAAYFCFILSKGESSPNSVGGEEGSSTAKSDS